MSLLNKYHLKSKSWVKPAEKIPHIGRHVRGLGAGPSETVSLRKREEDGVGVHSGQFSVHPHVPCLPNITETTAGSHTSSQFSIYFPQRIG